MKLILLKPNSPEWDFAWNWVASHPLNEGQEDPSTALNEGEAWQYMGSFKQGDRVIHTFRHRNHPTTSTRQTLNLNASEALTQEQINKIFRL